MEVKKITSKAEYDRLEEAGVNGGLNDEQAAAVQAGLAMHIRVKGQLEESQAEVKKLQMACANAAVENESLRSFNNLLESRINAAVAERDQAVAERAQY